MYSGVKFLYYFPNEIDDPVFRCGHVEIASPRCLPTDACDEIQKYAARVAKLFVTFE